MFFEFTLKIIPISFFPKNFVFTMQKFAQKKIATTKFALLDGLG
jgi:hypothetical protein